jgi:hypothetical protein
MFKILIFKLPISPQGFQALNSYPLLVSFLHLSAGYILLEETYLTFLILTKKSWQQNFGAELIAS